MIIDRDYVHWLANEHRLYCNNAELLEAEDPWRLTFARRVTNEPEVYVSLWSLNRSGEPSRAQVAIHGIRHSIRGARRIKNNLRRVIAAIEQLHICDISDP